MIRRHHPHLFPLVGAVTVLAGLMLHIFVGCGDADISVPGSGVPTRPTGVATNGTPSQTPDDDL